MKKSDLLKIIKEEIDAFTVNEAGLFGLKDPKNAVKGYASTIDPDDATEKSQEFQSRYKKLSEEEQLDEEQLTEMASIKQLKVELKRQGKEEELKAITDTEQATLDALKVNPVFTSDGRLRGYIPAFKKELLNTHNINLKQLLGDIANDAEVDGVEFNDTISSNTIEKDAANQITGKEAGPRGPKADPNKAPKASKAPVKTEKPTQNFAKPATDDLTDEDGNKVEIDKTVKPVVGNAEIEAKLKDVISKKKDKLANAKGADYDRELAALKQFLAKPEISKYIKKKTVGGVNPYSIDSILN